ncbi:unnamed protein product [Adineta steineri]|uniref:Uncharacterized protein n=1 Tax=Adineta steineri TaxID=433720 RepID=A0A818X4U9_9BILA|nr:unnamed protein product [Adineta steineri]
MTLRFWLTIITISSALLTSSVIADDPCRFETTKGIIDLTSVGRTDGKPAYADKTPPASTDYKYSYNPCKPFTELPNCIGVAACQISADGKLSFSLGKQESVKWNPGAGMGSIPSITYTQGAKVVTVTLVCSTDGSEDFDAMGESPINNYKFRLSHKCACWNGCGDVPPQTSTSSGSTTTTAVIIVDPCKYQTEKGIIDLTSVGRTDGKPAYADKTPPASADYKYSYNPCKPFTELPNCIGVAACQVSADGKLSFSLGKQESVKWNPGAGMGSIPSITYTQESVKWNPGAGMGSIPSITYTQGAKVVTVTLVCSTDGSEDFDAMGESPINNYKFRLSHKCACWDGCRHVTPQTSTTSTTSTTISTVSVTSMTTSSTSAASTTSTASPSTTSTISTPLASSTSTTLPISTSTSTISTTFTTSITTTTTTTTTTAVIIVDPCKYQTEKGIIDLTSVGRTDGKPAYADKTPPALTNYKYSYNPCKPFTEHPNCIGVAACQISADGKLSFSLGKQESVKWNPGAGLASLPSISYSEGFKQVTVTLQCSTDGSENFEAFGESPVNNYKFRLIHKCACYDGCKNVTPQTSTSSGSTVSITSTTASTTSAASTPSTTTTTITSTTTTSRTTSTTTSSTSTTTSTASTATSRTSSTTTPSTTTSTASITSTTSKVIIVDPCKYQTEKGIIDLTSVGRTDGKPAYADKTPPAFADYKYSYNPCKPFTELPNCIGVAACQISADGKLSFSLGKQESVKWNPGAGLGSLPSVTYTQGAKVVTVTLVCSTDGTEDFDALGESPINNYKFRLSHKCACWDGCAHTPPQTSTTAPGGGGAGLGGGAEFIMILLVLVFVCFVGFIQGN